MLNHHQKTILSASVSALILAGCGGGGGGNPQNDPIAFSATLIAPEVTANTTAFESRLRYNGRDFQARMAGACTGIPDGYGPLANVDIDALDADGNLLTAAVGSTDECGMVSISLPAGSDKIRASSAGFRDLVAGVDAVAANGGLASTIPDTADYRVGFLTSYEDDTLGFTITDTITNKAVVGLPIEAFSVELDATSAGFTSISSALTSEDASIVLVTDASGSMDNNAYTDPMTSTSYSRNNLAANAAHQFLDQKAATDEVAMIIFDGSVDLINQDYIDNDLFLQDLNGAAVPYALSESGFTTDSSALRLIVDTYNEDAKVWGATRRFDNHPDTPEVEKLVMKWLLVTTHVSL